MHLFRDLLGPYPNYLRNCGDGISDKTALKKMVGLQKMRLIILPKMKIFHMTNDEGVVRE